MYNLKSEYATFFIKILNLRSGELMNFNRIVSTAAALAFSAGMVTVFPELTQETYAAEVVANSFEINYEGWHPNADNVVLTAESGCGYSNSRGMNVTGRTSYSDGAASSKGFYLEGGVEYQYRVMVRSDYAETFRLSLMYIDEDTEKETTVQLAAKKAAAGEWTELSAKFKAPSNTYEYELTITADSTNDFTFDDVSITSKEQTAGLSAYAAESGLKDKFDGYFRVGNILNGGTIKNSAITANILKDCNSVECENETKPDATLNQAQCNGTNIAVKLDNAAAIMDFCSKNNIGMRGHTLVWHSQTPSWFFKENYSANGAWVSSSVMDQRMESYIKNMFSAIKTQYPNLDLYAYDVCNECVSDDSNRTANNGGARVPGDNNVNGGTSAWVQVYGDNSFVEKAFTYARKYAPAGCDLYYNDYNEYWDHKRDCIYNMCKDLYQKGLLDGVGMQSHVPANATGFAGTDSYIEAMKKYLSIGCDVQITELDISLESGKYTLQEQADKYKAIFQAAVDWNSAPQSDGRVTAVCIWGPNDANSWLKSGSDALLYDQNNQPKAAYTALMNMDVQPPVVKPVEPDENGWYFHSTFEGDTDDWGGRGAADVLTSGRTSYKGSEALLVENRTAAWNGTTKPLNTKAFIPGNEYSFSVNVNYFDGSATDKFFLKLQYTDGNGDTQYSTIAEGTGIKGEWVQLANTNYKIPEDAKNMQIYVETAETSNNFYIDEAIGAVAGTVIEGAGNSEPIILGDINGDGKINALDMSLARKGLISGGFFSSRKSIAADVDQSGKFEINDAVLIQQYILRKITEFPVAEKVIDTEAMETLFKSVNVASSWKYDGENNPLTTERFGADPGYLVYDGRLYVYTTNDAFEYENGSIRENTYDVGTINCVSSSDLVNWTDHGAIPVADKNGRTQNGAAKWANCSWAPDACWKMIDGKPKFFLYFANNGSGIGVLTADSPTGPWTDPLGKELISRSTPNCGNVAWLFDPAVYYDEKTDEAYLFFGGGKNSNDGTGYDNPKTGRCVKLGKDMISIEGTPQTMETPYLFEDSSITKIGDTWYYSYCSNWNVPSGTSINGQLFNSADICYMTSKNPLGPWTKDQFAGMLFANTGSQKIDNGGNNHHSLVEFKGKYYVIYHSRQQEIRMNGGKDRNYRSTQINEAVFDQATGKITCKGDMKGVSQLETLNPYTTVQAETMSNQSNDISVEGLGDTVVKGTKGSWIKASGVNFSNGADTLTIKASSKNGAVIKVCTGSANGTAITYAEIPAGSSMSEITVPVVNSVSGNKDIYFVFSDNISFDSWSFK